MTEKLCHCGKPLHYKSTRVKTYVEKLIAELGEYVIVNTNSGRWKVPRHYIALHGLKAIELPSLGFEEARD